MAIKRQVPGLNRGAGMAAGPGFLLGRTGVGRGPIQPLNQHDLAQLGLQSLKSPKGAGQAIATSASISAASASISVLSAAVLIVVGSLSSTTSTVAGLSTSLSSATTSLAAVSGSISTALSTAESYALSTTTSLSTGVSGSLSSGLSTTVSLSTALSSSLSSNASVALSSTTSLSTGVSTSASSNLSTAESYALSSTTSLSTAVSTNYLPLAGGVLTGGLQGTTLALGGALASGDLLSVYSAGATAVIEAIGDAQLAEVIATRYSSDTIQGIIIARKARGTFASPSTVAAADVAGSYSIQAYDGGAFRSIATITGTVNTYTGSNNLSGNLFFSTRPDGAAAGAVERLRIDKNGLITVLGGTIQILDQNGGIYGTHAPTYSRQVPLTGFSITIGNSVNSLILNPAGTLATGTVTMPATPLDGHEVVVASSQIITALTVQANAGQTIDGGIAAATFAANAFAKWQYVLADTKWYRIG